MLQELFGTCHIRHGDAFNAEILVPQAPPGRTASSWPINSERLVLTTGAVLASEDAVESAIAAASKLVARTVITLTPSLDFKVIIALPMWNKKIT